MAKTTAEIEIENHVLKDSWVLLSDGTRGQVFSRGPRNEKNVFVYTCHICNIDSLTGEHFLQSHIQGRKHQTKMELKVHDAVQFRALKPKNPKIAMDIAPGEPVPPGFENEVKPFAQLQATLDKFKLSPLVGLEYIMELIPDESEGGEPGYHCILCDKRGDPRTIMAHLTSYNHRVKYLEKHFPGVIKEIGPIRHNKEACKRHIPQEMIERVCKSIEDYHGRLTPNVHPAKNYELNKMKYLQEAIFDKHFDERTGPKFLDAIDRKAIELFFKSMQSENGKENDEKSKEEVVVLEPSRGESVIELSDASSISSGSIGSPTKKRRRNDSNAKRRKSISPFSRKRRLSRSPVKPAAYRRNSRSPPRRGVNPRVKLDHLGSMSEKTPFDKAKAIIEPHTNFAASLQGKMSTKCRDEINKSVELLKRMNKEYMTKPERHPEYNDEWKRFWNRRFKEVQKEGKDPNKYDFKPDWIEYWTERMKELFNEDIDRKVKEIQKKYKSKSPSPARSSKSRHAKRSHSKERRRRRSRSSSLSSLESVGHVRRSTRSRSKSRSYAASEHFKDPYKDDFYSRSRPVYPGYEMDPYAPPGYYGAYGVPPVAPYYGKHPPTKVPSKDEAPKEEVEEEESNDPITFVSVLRSVSVVEDYLGDTLGPRVINLLSQALGMEKEKPNSADEYLLNSDVCVLLETVKEKLKGKLNEKLVKESEEKATKKAIKNIAELVHIFSSKNKKDGENSTEEVKKRPPEVETVATRIKSALIVQGKTDTTEDVIDDIISIIVDMAKHHDLTPQFSTKTYLVKNKYVEDKTATDETDYENLTDADLKVLLQNFQAISHSEQQHVLKYVRKLEITDKERVRKLQTYLKKIYEDDDEPEVVTRKVETPLEKLKKEEPQDPRLAGIQISKPKTDIFLSDDEDDYNDDDLVKSTKSLTSDPVTHDENTNQSSSKDDTVSRDSNSFLNKLYSADTQNIIASLMGSLQQSINTVQQSKSQPVPVAPVQEKPVTQPPKITGYNQYVAKNTIQATRDPNQAQKLQQMAQQRPQQPPQQNTPFRAQGNSSLFPIQQQAFPFANQIGGQAYGNQMGAQGFVGQYQGQNNGTGLQNQQMQSQQQQRTGHTSYVRTNPGNAGINPWQMPPQQQQQQQQQQQNNRGSQPFFQYYQN